MPSIYTCGCGDEATRRSFLGIASCWQGGSNPPNRAHTLTVSASSCHSPSHCSDVSGLSTRTSSSTLTWDEHIVGICLSARRRNTRGISHLPHTARRSSPCSPNTNYSMRPRPPRIRAMSFHLIPATFTPTVPNSNGALVCSATLPTVICLLCGSCSSGQMFAADFFQIPPRDGHPCLGLCDSRY